MEQKKAYKAALRLQIDTIKAIDGSDFPTEGVITFAYNLETGESVSIINDGISTKDDGGTGGGSGRPFP
jgi:hypothetical protein